MGRAVGCWLQRGQPEAIFAIGLLRDLGKLVIYRRLQKGPAGILSRFPASDQSQDLIEQDVLALRSDPR